jgi:hypothetical protein
MDGRKNNSGTKGNKGGRPPKADEIRIAENIDNVIKIPELFQILATISKDLKSRDRMKALELLLSYRLGKPHQTVDNNIKVEEIKRPIWFDEE